MRNVIAALAIVLSVGGFVYAQNQGNGAGPRAQVRVGGSKLDLVIDGQTLAQTDGTWTVSGDVVINVGGVQLVADRAVLSEAARNALTIRPGETAEVALEGKVRLILRQP